MSNETVTEVTLPEFYVEMHHTRGNVSKFELFDQEHDQWFEVSVWDYRPGKVAENFWQNAWELEQSLQMIEEMLDLPITPRYRVTRYPELEKDMVDETYHPSVSSEHIDLTYVEGLLTKND